MFISKINYTSRNKSIFRIFLKLDNNILCVMNDKFQYRLSRSEKKIIAKNLIDILQKDTEIIKETRTFICNWILTGPDEKRKAFFDVWDIVLRNYIPKTRPILFHACARISKRNKIASFTGRLECVRRFSSYKGSIIVCDTKETLQFEEKIYQIGEYKNTFYPLADVLKKAKDMGGCGFSEKILNDFIGEDEYIMRIDIYKCCNFKWSESNF